MDSFEVAQGFRFRDRSPETMGEAEDAEKGGFYGVLEVYIHHARNIHNICIYDNQDVYAKFSLTCRPDEVVSTRVARGGGRNPEFHERLSIRVANHDAVLKCEMWMLSRARDYLEDQLLGFALVPLSSVAAATGEGKTTQDFTLSSTDLFHTPAGTVRLTLSLSTSPPGEPSDGFFAAAPSSSIASEVVLLDPGEYVSIEFPDIGVARENQRMVSEYFSLAEEHGSPSKPIGVAGSPGAGVPFLHLGAASQSMEDYDMAANSGEENNGESISPEGSSVQNSGVFSSTTTSLSEDRNSVDSAEKKNPECANGSRPAATRSSETPPETPTSKVAGVASDNRESRVPLSSEGTEGAENSRSAGAMEEIESVFKSPLGSINFEKEQSAMQQQIVDMYMRSMQQFTESLAKMKLPMDLDKPTKEDGGDVIQSRSSNLDKDGKKKDGSRVFYGSRAFF